MGSFFTRKREHAVVEDMSQRGAAVVRSEKLVAEAGDNSGTQRKMNVRH
jgi:hypothetical protein